MEQYIQQSVNSRVLLEELNERLRSDSFAALGYSDSGSSVTALLLNERHNKLPPKQCPLAIPFLHQTSKIMT